MLEKLFSRLSEIVHPDPQPNVLMTIEPIRIAGSWQRWSSIRDQIRSLFLLKAHGFDVRWTIPLISFKGSLKDHLIVIGPETLNIPAHHHMPYYDPRKLIQTAIVCAEADFI